MIFEYVIKKKKINKLKFVIILKDLGSHKYTH